MQAMANSKKLSTNGKSYHLFRNSNPLFWCGIILFILCLSPLIASETEEILGPESGVVNLRWRSNDKIQFRTYRVAESQTGVNVYQHESGRFYYDQQSVVNLVGKTESERTKKAFKRSSYVLLTKNNSYLPPQPDFSELAAGGDYSTGIKKLSHNANS